MNICNYPFILFLLPAITPTHSDTYIYIIHITHTYTQTHIYRQTYFYPLISFSLNIYSPVGLLDHMVFLFLVTFHSCFHDKDTYMHTCTCILFVCVCVDPTGLFKLIFVYLFLNLQCLAICYFIINPEAGQYFSC